MALTIDELKELIQADEHRQLELKKTMCGSSISTFLIGQTTK